MKESDLKVGMELRLPFTCYPDKIWTIEKIEDYLGRISCGDEVTHWFVDDLVDAEVVVR